MLFISQGQLTKDKFRIEVKGLTLFELVSWVSRAQIDTTVIEKDRKQVATFQSHARYLSSVADHAIREGGLHVLAEFRFYSFTH
jgi:hypothetical protein